MMDGPSLTIDAEATDENSCPYKIRTIDVWDTILRRRSSPEFSKLASARALLLAWGHLLDLGGGDHWAIYRERCLIEVQLRGNSGREFCIQDVMERLVRHFMAAEIASDDVSDLAKELVEIEFAFERRNTYLDRHLLEFIEKYPAERTIFLSDFYMPADRLNRLLAHHGASDRIPDGISSCDIGLNKRSGGLFAHVHAKFGVSPSEHVHIGDDRHSDVEVPRRKGVHAVHFEPESEHRKRRLEAGLLGDRNALLRHIVSTAVAEAEGEAAGLNHEARQAFEIGLRAAPLIIGFLLHVAEQVLSDKAQRLFFFSREGELFLQVWLKLFPDDRFAGLQMPAPRLLEVSRIATFCGSLRDVSTTEMMRLWTLYSSQSMEALLLSLGLDPAPFSEVCRAHGLPLGEKVAQPWKDARVKRLFDDPSFAGPILEKSRADREALTRYLDQQGWDGSASRVAIVDIGWRGTIQDNLSSLFPECQVTGHYMGLLRFLNVQPPNCRKTAFGPDLNSSAAHEELLRGIPLLEMLCNSPNGSVVGYAVDDAGKARAKRLIDDKENEAFHAFSAFFQQAITSIAGRWGRFIDSHVVGSEELRSAAYAVWRQLVRTPGRGLVEIHTSLAYNELFGLGSFVDKRIVPSAASALAALVRSRPRMELVLFVKQTFSAAMIWHRKDLTVAHRALLVAILELASVCRRLVKFGKFARSRAFGRQIGAPIHDAKTVTQRSLRR
jgi:FMN phosphatase YigB (HAD superfamily)